MLDKSIPYYDFIMHRKQGTPLQEVRLHEGFKFVLFQDGDEKHWADIESSVGEFVNSEEALKYFNREFMPLVSEVKRRCLFIENSYGEKVATLTTWWSYTGVRRDPWLHWVAVKPEYQGLGLGKALVFQGMKQMVDIEGDRDVYLHTQTWSYKAVNIYIKAGFYPTDEIGLGGCEIKDYDKAMNLLARYLH